MRLFLATLAVVGLFAIGLVVFFATGLLQLPQPRAVSIGSTAVPVATRPAAPDDSGGPADDDSDWADPPAPVLPDPSALDRAIVLAAEEAKLSGRRVRLYTTDADGREARGDRERGMGRQREQARRLRGRSEEGPPPVIRGWMGPQDVAEWDFVVPQDGSYAVTLVYNSGGGGKFELAIGDEKLNGVTESTGRGYRMIEVGRVTLTAGQQTLRLRPAETLEDPLMTLRGVRLYPVP